MNTETGHLVKVLDQTTWAQLNGYEPVPQELDEAAKRALNGRDDVWISLHSGGKLSRWAAGKRKQRWKMAAASRKANRR